MVLSSCGLLPSRPVLPPRRLLSLGGTPGLRSRPPAPQISAATPRGAGIGERLLRARRRPALARGPGPPRPLQRGARHLLTAVSPTAPPAARATGRRSGEAPRRAAQAGACGAQALELSARRARSLSGVPSPSTEARKRPRGSQRWAPAPRTWRPCGAVSSTSRAARLRRRGQGCSSLLGTAPLLAPPLLTPQLLPARRAAPRPMGIVRAG